MKTINGIISVKFVIIGFVTTFLFLIFDMVFRMLTGSYFELYSILPIWETLPNIMALIFLGTINGFILAGVFMTIYAGIPGSGWRKGLNYGIIVGLFRIVMSTLSVDMLNRVPIELIAEMIIIGFIETLILCVALALLYEKIMQSPRRAK